jgi:hypothetical protein
LLGSIDLLYHIGERGERNRGNFKQRERRR